MYKQTEFILKDLESLEDTIQEWHQMCQEENIEEIYVRPAIASEYFQIQIVTPKGTCRIIDMKFSNFGQNRFHPQIAIDMFSLESKKKIREILDSLK